MVNPATIYRSSCGGRSSEVIRNGRLQPAWQQGTGKEERRCTRGCNSRIALFQALALQGVQEVHIEPGSAHNGEPGAEVEVTVRRQRDARARRTLCHVVPVALERKAGAPGREEDGQIAQRGRNPVEPASDVGPTSGSHLGLEDCGAADDLQSLERADGCLHFRSIGLGLRTGNYDPRRGSADGVDHGSLAHDVLELGPETVHREAQSAVGVFDTAFDRLDFPRVEEIHLLLRRSVQELVQCRHLVPAVPGSIEGELLVQPVVEAHRSRPVAYFPVKVTEAPVPEQLVVVGRGGVAVEVHSGGVFRALHEVVILAPDAEIGTEPLSDLQLPANYG